MRTRFVVGEVWLDENSHPPVGACDSLVLGDEVEEAPDHRRLDLGMDLGPVRDHSLEAEEDNANRGVVGACVPTAARARHR